MATQSQWVKNDNEIKVRDHLNMKLHAGILKFMGEEETILVSCTIQIYTGFLYFMKKRKLILTTHQIITCNEKVPVKATEAGQTYINGSTHKHETLEGITMSLIKD